MTKSKGVRQYNNFVIDRKLFIKLYIEEDVDPKEIAKQYNVTLNQVYNMAKKIGVSKKDLKINISYEELYDLYIAENKDVRDIAKLYGVTESQINNRLYSYGIKKEMREPKINAALAKQLFFEERKTYGEIGEFFNVSGEVAKQWFYRQGINELDRKITKEQLEKLLIHDELTTVQIGEIFKKSSSQVLNYINEYNIDRATIYDKYVLTELQKDLIVGSILGDGCVYTRKGDKNSQISISHASNQKEYLKFKFNILKNLCNMKGIVEKRVKIEYGSYNKQTLYWFYSKSLPQLNKYSKMTIFDTIDHLNKNSFVIWLMDDGYGDRNKYYSIGMRKHGIEGVEYAIKKIKKEFNIESKVHWGNANKTILTGIRFPRSETAKIKELIMTCDFAEEILRTMEYKIPSVNLEEEVVCQTASSS